MEKGYRIKVAIFSLIAIFLVIAGYMWFTEFKVNLQRYYYEVTVDDASWLERGDIVTVMGVNKGRVENIDIEKDKVVIKFFLDGIKLREGTRIFVENQGFLGRKRLVVKQGKGRELPSGTRIEGGVIPDLGDLVRQGGEILELVKTTVLSLNKTIDDVDKTIEEVKNSLVILSGDLKKTSMTLREFVKKGDDVDKVIQNLTEISGRIEKVSAYLENEKGSLSKLLKDETLYNKIDSTITSLNDLIKDIKKNPRKYLKIEIF